MSVRSARLMRVIVSVVILCAASAGCRRVPDVFYASAEIGAKIIRIEVQDANQITTMLIGETGTTGCISMALSPSGTLYSLCGPGVLNPGAQQLATIDLRTGHANIFGTVVNGLRIMTVKFAPDGTLYAAGDADPKSPTFNSLYSLDTKTGVPTRIGPTGVSSFFMDFAFDRKGMMYGATSRTLYTIDRKTGEATKIADFVGGGDIMGLAFNQDDSKLYATDFKTPISDFYLVDSKKGLLTPIASTGYANSHNLVLANR